MVMNDMTDDGKWGAEIAVDGKRPNIPMMDAEQWQWKDEEGWYTASFKSDYGYDWHNMTVIRLPADHPHYQQTQTQKQTQTLTAQERLEKYEGFLRRLSSNTRRCFTEEIEEARALVAEMEPVDPDEERARDLAAKLAGVTLPASNPVHAGFATAGRVNEYISRPTTEAERMIGCMYRGIKEGRELARGDVA